MTIANALNVDIAYKAETTFGTLAGAAGAQLIRRVSSNLALGKQAYASEEVSEHLQVADMRHGLRASAGELQGELSAATYWDWIEAIVRGTEEATITRTQTEFTSMAADSGASKFTVALSNWVAQSFRVGDVIRFTGLSEPLNNDVNYRITSLSGVDAFVSPAPTTMGADTTFSVIRAGKKVSPPATRAAIIRRSYTIEQHYTDLDIVEVFTGCRMGRMGMSLPPTGLATVTWQVLGQNGQVLTGVSAPYFTTPAAPTSTGLTAAVDGKLRVGSVDVATVTGLDVSIDLGLSNQAVVGSNLSPDVFAGRTIITGSISFLMEDAVILNNFINEDTIELHMLLNLSGVAPVDFISIFMPRIKFTGNTKDIRNEGGVILNQPFQALKKATTTGYDATSIVIQDSLAV